MVHNSPVSLILQGEYVQSGTYFQFSFDAPELIRLSNGLLDAVRGRQQLLVLVGSGKLLFSYGSEIGEAELAPENTLMIKSNVPDLKSLAGEFLAMSENDDPDLIGLVHIHLEPIYINGCSNVSDIVFERSDDV